METSGSLGAVLKERYAMPSVSQDQQQFMGAELRRARSGKKTRTGMSISQLRDFASTKRKGLPKRKRSRVVRKMLRRHR